MARPARKKPTRTPASVVAIEPLPKVDGPIRLSMPTELRYCGHPGCLALVDAGSVCVRHRNPIAAEIADLWLRVPGNPSIDVEAETQRIIDAHEATEHRAYRAKQRDRAVRGVRAKRENKSRETERFVARLRALRAKYPNVKNARGLACLWLRLPTDERDPASRKQIEALAARIRRTR